MTANFPVSIVTHGLGLNITIQSYNGSLDYGLIACKRTVPKLREFADAMQAAHQELLDLLMADASVSGAVKPVPKRLPRPRAKSAAMPAAKPVLKAVVKKSIRGNVKAKQ